MIRLTIAVLLCAITFSPPSAGSGPGTISKQQFDQLYSELSNRGRWGKDDELGTLNFITPEVKIRAAGLVQKGLSISLALDLNTEKSDLNTHPFEHNFSVVNMGSQSVVSDKYSVEYHGAAHSHLDALSHMTHEGKTYNGFTAEIVESAGLAKLGIHNMADGIVSRGVLVDIPWLRGVEFLDPGDAVSLPDFEAWEAKTGITIRAGDVLLVRTGRWQRDRKFGSAHLIDGAAGLHASTLKWLKQRDVAVLGSDGGNDVIPSGVEALPFPIHVLALTSLGMPLMDNLDLDALADEALKQERWEFLFVATPLRVHGGAGSPINPVAVF